MSIDSSNYSKESLQLFTMDSRNLLVFIILVIL